MPAKFPGICRFGLFLAQTSLRLGSEPGKFDGFPGKIERKREGAVEK